MSEFDTKYTTSAVCPYCGHVCRYSEEINSGEEGEADAECGSCGMDYLFSRNIRVSYSTYKIKGEA